MNTDNQQSGQLRKRRDKILIILLIMTIVFTLLSQSSLTTGLAQSNAAAPDFLQVNTETPTATSTSTATSTTTSTPTPTNTSTATPTLAPVMISFQNGVSPSSSYAGMVDTYISQNDSLGNYGQAVSLLVNGETSAGNADANYALLKWDISQIPTGSEILSASLTFSVTQSTVDTYPIYQLLQPWVFNQANWNFYAGTQPWQIPGAAGVLDRGTQVLASFSPLNTGEYTINLNRTVVQEWVNGVSPNHGIIIADSSGSDPTTFNSAEASLPTDRPKLSIQYKLPPGTTPTPTNTATPTPLAPNAPTLLTATAASSTQINLSWADNSTDESGFQIERSTDQTNWTLIATTATDVTTYNNTGLTVNTTYFYRVRAFNDSGASAYTNIASATTSGTPTPTVSGTPPTPTVTGTITPNTAIQKSVSPSQARVGQLFNFTIELTNSGTAPALTSYITDTFPSVLTITGASTNRGTYTINTTTNTITFTLGTINPGDSVKVVVLAQVNTTATANSDHTNSATLTYVVSSVTQSRTSNSVSYRVIGSGTLPGTGLSDETSTSENSWILIVTLAIAGLLAMIGLVLFALSYPARKKASSWADWLARTGLILTGAALLFGLVSWGLNLPTPTTTQVANPTDTLSSVALNFEPAAESIEFVFPTPTPESLPDYAVPSPTLSADQPEDETDTSDVEHILIPAIGLDTVVKYVPFDGYTWQIAGLKQEIAWMGDTSWPGLGKNTGLAGHVTLVDGSDGPFRYLSDLRAGDVVSVYTQENIYTYKVREQLVVEDADFYVLQPTDKAQLTLITCTNWDQDLKLYLNRLIVYADLDTIEPIKAANLGN